VTSKAQSKREAAVLLLAYNYPPANTSGSARPYRFAKYLPRFGYVAHVVSRPVPAAQAPPGVHWAPGAGESSASRRFSRGCWRALHRLASPFDDRLPWVPDALDAAEEVIREIPVTAVVSTSPPLANHVVGMQVKKRTGLPWVADFRDPLLGNPFRGGMRARVHDWLVEAGILKSADLIIANTDTLAQLLLSRYPEHRSKITTIPNGFDPDVTFGPAPIPPRSYRVVAHVGTIYGARHPARFLAALDKLIESGKIDAQGVRVELTGNVESTIVPMTGPPFTTLRELGVLQFDGKRVPKEEALQRIAEADYLLLLDLNESNSCLQVPAKLFDYVRIGRPILAFTSPGSPTARVLELSGVPFRCIHSTDSADRVEELVMEFLKLPTEPVPFSSQFAESYSAIPQTRQLARHLDALRGECAPTPGIEIPEVAGSASQPS
jgi:glycosyltransferase involved in cell wall biosynthesis